MKKIILCVMLLGVVALQSFGKPKYRIEVKKIEGVIHYTPQVKKKVEGLPIPQWVDLSNQPLKSENEARNYVREEQVINNQIQQSTIIQYINIK
jgi:hypothetical protein